ncbi:MAG: Flp pilus assembly protein CpaB [Burkholderiaceae bacterium]
METVTAGRKAVSWIQQRRGTLLLVAALMIGAVAAVGTRNYIAEQLAIERERLHPQHEEIDVIVAKRDLLRGEFVGPETMAVRRIPKAFASSALVRPDRFDAYLGARLSMPLNAGEPLISQGVEGFDSSAFSTKVRNGIRALTIAVDEINSMSGMLQPGDRIDLQLTARPQASGTSGAMATEITKLLMQDLLVLATGRQVRQQAEDGARPRVFTAITVEATPEQAQKLIVAQRSGRLTATLRNRDDRAVIAQKALDINELLGLPAEAARRRTPSLELIVGGQGPLRPLAMNAAGIGATAPDTDSAAAATALLQQIGSAAGAMNAGLAGLPATAAPRPSRGAPAANASVSASVPVSAPAPVPAPTPTPAPVGPAPRINGQ